MNDGEGKMWGEGHREGNIDMGEKAGERERGEGGERERGSKRREGGEIAGDSL